MKTFSGEIAVCVEKAYEKISLKDAARMLYLPNEEAAEAFGAKTKNGSWGVTTEIKNTNEPIPFNEFAEQAIDYAKKLEMIV